MSHPMPINKQSLEEFRKIFGPEAVITFAQENGKTFGERLSGCVQASDSRRMKK
jgi:hypothetical protein